VGGSGETSRGGSRCWTRSPAGAGPSRTARDSRAAPCAFLEKEQRRSIAWRQCRFTQGSSAAMAARCRSELVCEVSRRGWRYGPFCPFVTTFADASTLSHRSHTFLRPDVDLCADSQSAMYHRDWRPGSKEVMQLYSPSTRPGRQTFVHL